MGMAPAVISDHMEGIKHHGSGRYFTSKRAFSQETRRLGMVEMGNELPKPRQPIRLDKRQRADDIRKAIYELRNR
jgi:hypothetical protein